MGRAAKMGEYSTLPELIEAALAGDQLAFSTLFDRYRLYAWGVALRVTSNKANADDAVIDGFASAFNTLERLREPLHFPGYLASCVRNEALMAVRGKRESVSIDGIEETLTDGCTPESVLESDLDGRGALSAFGRLDDRQQHAVFLVYIEGTPISEAAAALNLTVNAFHQLLFRARRTLRLRFIAPALDDHAPASCHTCNDELAAYIRGSSSVRVTKMVEDHIDDCTGCSQRLGEARATSELLARATGKVGGALKSAPAPTHVPASAARTRSTQASRDHRLVRNVGLAAVSVATVASVASPPHASSRVQIKTNRSEAAATSRTRAANASSAVLLSSAASPPSWLVLSTSSTSLGASAGLVPPAVEATYPDAAVHSTFGDGVVRPGNLTDAEQPTSHAPFALTPDDDRPSVMFFGARKLKGVRLASSFDEARIIWPHAHAARV